MFVFVFVFVRVRSIVSMIVTLAVSVTMAVSVTIGFECDPEQPRVDTAAIHRPGVEFERIDRQPSQRGRDIVQIGAEIH